jgi:hypothetical protein
VVTTLVRATAAAAFLASVPVAQAQDLDSSYLDETARELHLAAMDARAGVDDSVLKYTAVVKQRIGAALRTPLKDRTLYRMESAHRLFWSRDGDNLVQVLALRQQTPIGVEEVEEELLDELDFFADGFDPMNDRLLFGADVDEGDLGTPGEDDFWFEHPLYPEYVDSYRFRTGDTLTISFPDGRRVLAVELQVLPRIADVHRMTGSLWIEPESGALVRAVYRLSDAFDAFRDIPELKEEEDDDLRFVPGILKPWTAEISMIAVDYALWDFEVWLPRSMRMEGVVSAGILKAPGSIDFSYEMESVTTENSLLEDRDDGLPEVHFRTRSEAMQYLNERAYGADVAYELDEGRSNSRTGRTRLLYPRDLTVLAESPELPPPIWDDAPGFASEEELTELFDRLADLPTPPVAQVPSTLRWGLQRPDLVRYNRVEALSIGIRGQLRPQTFVGPLTVTGTARLGVADLEPNVRLDVTRETLRRKVTLSAYNELAAIDEGARHLGIGNSLMAMLFGRDDGDYYRRSGAALEWTPPTAGRASYRFRAYSEYQRVAGRETKFALFRWWNGSFAFRPNLAAQEGWEHGALLELSPWWGSDPFLTQGGLDLKLQGGTGDIEYARTSLVGRLVVPLPADMRLGVEAGAGTSWGEPSPQRLWYVGGSRTLRGYDPVVLGGSTFWRARGELARTYPFGSVSLFSDVGWAGDRDRIRFDDALYSVGAGVSILDGLIRMDGAYGLRDPKGFRLDLYLDAIL